jgi:2',3'-cyclic-nucleotide 2'-phosphodiesterase (5'-nucleotidase family)
MKKPFTILHTNDMHSSFIGMDHLRNLPVQTKGELPTIPVEERAAEVRVIKVV